MTSVTFGVGGSSGPFGGCFFPPDPFGGECGGGGGGGSGRYAIATGGDNVNNMWSGDDALG